MPSVSREFSPRFGFGASFSRRLRGSSAVALADQLIVSLGNFGTNILVARSLPADQYGVFSLLLEAILFLNTLQAALLVYPLTIRAALMDEDEVRRFSGTCVLLTLFLTIPLGGMLIAYGALNHVASIAVWAALGQTMWQTQEVLRRTMLARGGFAQALAGDIISYLGQAMVIWLLIFGGMADVSRVFMAMAVTSLLAALVQGFQLSAWPAGILGSLHIGRSFWLMGRWVMTSQLSIFFSGVCCSYALTRSHGKSAMGAYAALGTLLRLANPLLLTLSTLITPAVVVAQRSGGFGAARRAMVGLTVKGLILLFPYWAVLFFFPQWVVGVLYPSRAEYHGLNTELRIFVGCSMVTLLNIGIIALLNGLGRSRRAMIGQLCGAAASIIVTVPLTIEYGVRGILLGTLASNVVISIALLTLTAKLDEESASLLSEH